MSKFFFMHGFSFSQIDVLCVVCILPTYVKCASNTMKVGSSQNPFVDG